MSKHIVKHRVGGWLPQDHRVLHAYLEKLVQEVKHANHSVNDFHPVIREFKDLIEDDAEIWMGFHQMFEEVPLKPPYLQDPTLKPQIRDYMTMLRAFNLILTRAPQYEQDDLVGFPINAILDWPMGTTSGLATFLNPTVNKQFKKMFDVWAEFLKSRRSCSVLTTEANGWFGVKASADMPSFADTFVCNPHAPHHGFHSWDDFFTRSFRPGVRPVQFPDNNDIVNSGCESTVYCISHNVQLRDSFWLKGEPYSLQHMFHNDPLTSQFVGGTIYQAFLSALNYHRWHSPINGVVVKTTMIPGSYYAESPAMGFENPDGPDDSGPNLSQSFITSVAARSLMFIQADNPKIGLMAFMTVGMAEVSTCEMTVKQGDRVKKGQELGMFHFGGSTHCLIFRPETKVTFDPDYSVGAKVLLNAAIATVG